MNREEELLRKEREELLRKERIAMGKKQALEAYLKAGRDNSYAYEASALIAEFFEPDGIITFAMEYQEKANIPLLQNAIIKSEDPEFIYCFAKFIEKADIKKLAEAMKTIDPFVDKSKYIDKFFKEIEIPKETNETQNINIER